MSKRLSKRDRETGRQGGRETERDRERWSRKKRVEKERRQVEIKSDTQVKKYKFRGKKERFAPPKIYAQTIFFVRKWKITNAIKSFKLQALVEIIAKVIKVIWFY